ncbi:hypothetical protein T08_2272 [Trichinella sp. T8]|nr:hypothetical protein T08_2272 [Trichinella sp. T8]
MKHHHYTEADLKPSNDEVIAFNKKGNVGTAADCSDLSMGPTELLFCSDHYDKNSIALKTDKLAIFEQKRNGMLYWFYELYVDIEIDRSHQMKMY